MTTEPSAILRTCRTFCCTPRKLRRLVASGAVNPIVLMRGMLVAQAWNPHPFPWRADRFHIDLVETVFEFHVANLFRSRAAKENALARVHETVFGRSLYPRAASLGDTSGQRYRLALNIT